MVLLDELATVKVVLTMVEPPKCQRHTLTLHF